MKALVLEEYGRFALREVDPPAVGPGEVLIRVAACGICGSDVHGMDGSTGRRRPPVIMGHEAAGTVVAAGADAAGWAPGDRVTFDSTMYCGACAHCLAGRVNLCEERRVLGVSCEEYRMHGAFAEFVAVPARVLHRLPGGLPFVHAALAEPVSIALHAARRGAAPADGAALVVGAGMIGLLLIQVLRHLGQARILAADVDPAKLALARALGATETFDARTEGLPGADLVFDVVGSAETVSACVHAAHKGGTVVLVGNLAPAAPLPLQAAVTRELTLLGSCASRGEYPEALALLERGAINANAMISAVAPLAEGADWFARLYRKEPGLLKVILEP